MPAASATRLKRSYSRNWKSRISFGPNMTFWPALVISLIFAIVLGLVFHFFIFRPLRTAPPLAKVVASIGLFLYLPAVIIRRFTIQPYTVKPMPFFESDSGPLDRLIRSADNALRALFAPAQCRSPKRRSQPENKFNALGSGQQMDRRRCPHRRGHLPIGAPTGCPNNSHQKKPDQRFVR